MSKKGCEAVSPEGWGLQLFKRKDFLLPVLGLKIPGVFARDIKVLPTINLLFDNE